MEGLDKLSIQELSWRDDKTRALNLDMWLKFTDCFLCEQKSIPNTQSVLIDHRARNILTAFNKTLQVWKFEKS